jgi:uncharacterized protein YkwD
LQTATRHVLLAQFCRRIVASLLVLSLLPFSSAVADIADELNAIRAKGCEGRRGVKTSLRETDALAEVAREWSKGGRLRDAIKRTEHRLATSSSMHVSGGKDEATIVEVLADNYCDVILDESFSEIGVYRGTRDVWVVVATRHQAPAPGSAAEISARALELVNAARAKRRKCGNTTFQPAPPLKLAPLLERAALAHAKDMAQHSAFTHIGSDGSRPADRVTRTGYSWRNVAENIAAAAPDVETVVQGWLESPGHCTNIMGPQFKEMGIAYVVDPRSKEEIYWAQVFGTQR